MIRSAILKLTLAYLGIFMALSLSFSLALYRISSVELDRGLRRPGGYAFRVIGSGPSFEEFRIERLEESLANLRANLIVLNVVMLGIGAAASYFLAQRTLQPIEQAMEAQSRFTADASHELRTPLTAMQTELEVALRDPKLSKKEASDLLKSSLEEVGKLKNLTEGLLRLAQAEGVASPHLKSLDVQQAIRSAIRQVKTAAEQKGIQLIDESIGGKILGDPSSLKELFVILLDNAVKYSGPKTGVTIRTVMRTKHCEIQVIDQGPGISEKDLPHVFDRFYRADTSRTKNDAQGYGLGLSIAKHIAAHHHGHISATSKLGVGTTFTVHFPLA